MKTAQVKGLSPFERLVYWIKEREAIRRKRCLGLGRPWTDDEILRKYRFCNVRRMDDKVSQWLLENWYKPNKDHHNAVPAAACARLFNRPDSLSLVSRFIFRSGDPLWDDAQNAMQVARRSGCRVFNGAYVVSTSGNKADKVEWVVQKYLKPLTGMVVPTETMASAHRSLSKCYGFNSFMAGQVVADLRWLLSGVWKDRKTWAPLGPGSARGLARLGRQGDMEGAIEDLYGSLPSLIANRLEGIDLQNCLCEWDKYERTLWGEGRPKQLFEGC